MELKSAFATALRDLRNLRGLTQEDFALVSSRTNVSLLERGKTIPTLEKLAQLCTVLEFHPLTVMAICYSLKEELSVDALLGLVVLEMEQLDSLLSDRDNVVEAGTVTDGESNSK